MFSWVLFIWHPTPLFQKRKEKSVVQFENPSVGTGAKIIWLVPILGNPSNTQKGRQPLQEAALQPSQCCPPPQFIDHTLM